MSDSITVTKPIEIKDNSIERVAFDLMEKIAQAEHAKQDNFREPNSREYYLTLYRQCHKIVSGRVDVKDII